MDIEVRAVDPLDDDALVARLAIIGAAWAHDIPDFPPPCPVRFAVQLRRPDFATGYHAWLAYLDGRPAGTALMTLPLLDNTGNAQVDLQVAPAHRRHGVGRALYAHAVDAARHHDRIRMTSDTVATLPGGVARDGAGEAFAIAMGLKPALPEVRRRLDLSTVDIWALEQPEAPGYSLVRWRERAPEEYLADIARLDGRLVTDAPMGDLVLEAPKIDAARIRDYEETCIASRERRYQIGIVHDAVPARDPTAPPSGTLVAWTTLMFDSTTPNHAWQHITIVDPPHRGHRLGLWAKVANLRFAVENEPALRFVDTWNAAANGHMIAINEQVGFRAVDAFMQWQQDI